ncbi:MAG: hypothetical protein SGJ19_27745, partial [Planctomycetia bacterium]|nr:hypothetical protein [Planctomycetia bacterium]
MRDESHQPLATVRKQKSPPRTFGQRRMTTLKRWRNAVFEVLNPRWFLDGDPFYTAQDAEQGVDLRLQLDVQDGVEHLKLLSATGETLARQRIDDLRGPIRIVGSRFDDSFKLEFNTLVAERLLADAIEFDGGLGSDVLSGPNHDNTWTVNAANAGYVFRSDAVRFTGVENLRGGDDNQDEFVFEPGGRLDGLLHGGDRGFDTLVLQGGRYESVVYSAYGPDSGTVRLDGNLITYAGLEPIVDNSDPANVVIDATAGDDQLVLEQDPGNPGMLRVRALNGTLESVSFNVPTTSLVVNMAGGADTLTLTSFTLAVGASLSINGDGGADSVMFAGDLALPGGDLTVSAESITVSAGVSVSTRPAGANSGDILFTSNNVALANGAALLADADGGFTAGDVTINAAAAVNAVADANAQITVTGGTIRGRNITLAASSALTATNTANLAALVNVDASAQVLIDGASQIAGTGNVTLSALTNTQTTAQANSIPLPVVGADAAVAESGVGSTARTRVAGASNVTAVGTLSITANNTANVVTTGNGAGGGNTAIGAVVGIAVVDTTTEASVEGSASLNAATVNIAANSSTASTTTVTSTAQGTTNTVTPIPPGAATPAGNVSVAAAMALTTTTAVTRAYIATGGAIASAGNVNVTSTSSTVSAATADGTATQNPTGVGVGLAINIADTTNEAFLDGSSTITADAVNVSAQNGVLDDTFASFATSGVGALDVGVAGSVAINNANSTHAALVRSGANVALGGADLSLTTNAGTAATAQATPDLTGVASQDIGIGASVAFNNVTSSSRAQVENGAQITGGGGLVLDAAGDFTTNTNAVAGASGDTAVAPAVAMAFTDNQTVAEIGSGAAISLTGDVTVQATHTAALNTTSRGDAAGAGVGVGPAVALTIGNESALATVSRSVTAVGEATILSTANVDSPTQALATAKGADPSGQDANTLINQILAFADPNFGTPSAVNVPAAATADGSFGVAAAIAVDVTTTESLATIGNGATLNAALVQVAADNSTDAEAEATGATVDLTSGVAAAVAISAPSSTARALVDGTVNAGELLVRSGTGGGTQRFDVLAVSGAGSTNVGVAGALALHFPSATSEALMGPNANVTITGAGNATLTAGGDTTNTTIATSKVVADPAIGVGASVAVAYLNHATRAEMQNGAQLTGALDVTINASAQHTTATEGEAGAAGGTAVAPAVAVGISSNETVARLGSGALLSLTGGLQVLAGHVATSNATASGDAAGNGVAVGASVAVVAGDEDATAGIDRDVNAAGTITVFAQSDITSDSTSVAGANGAPGAGNPADQEIVRQLQAADPNSGTPDAVVVPNVADTVSDSATSNGIGMGQVGVAAAISVNAITSTADASIAANRNVTATTLQVSVRGNVEADIGAEADATAVLSATAVGAAIAVNAPNIDNLATIGAGANVAGHAIEVVTTSPTPLQFDARASAGAGADTVGVAGAIALNAASHSEIASVGANATVTAQEDIVVNAVDTIVAMNTVAGGAAVGDTAGVGISIALAALQNQTEAFLGANAQADAPEHMEVKAASNEVFATRASGGVDAGTVALAGSIVLNTLVGATRAHVDAGAQLNQSVPGETGQTVAVLATSSTTVVSGSGVAADSDIAGIGAGIDAGGLVKETIATLDGTVDAISNIFVTATSNEDITSLVGAKAIGDAVTIAGAGGIYLLNVTTRANIAGGANVHAEGSVQVSANQREEIDVSAGTNNSADIASIGASLAAPIVNKVTEAFVAPGATVIADGQGGGVLAFNGDFAISFAADIGSAGEVEVPDAIGVIADAMSFVFDNPIRDVLDPIAVSAPSDDSSLSQQRVATPVTVTVRGLAVSAVARDDIETIAVGFGAAFGVTPEISAAGNVATVRTSAYIGANAQINQDQTNAAVLQQVLVTAGTDYYSMGITGVGAVALGVAVGASGGIALTDILTEAYVGANAAVHAERDVQVLSRAREDVLQVAAGFAATLVFSVAASVPVVSLNMRTFAFIDSGATVYSEGNVLVLARDDTDTDTVAGAASVSLIGGVGTSVGGHLIDKDTRAWIGNGATVDAKANASVDLTVFSGSVNAGGFPTEVIRGLAVQAIATESTQSVAAAGGAGFGVGIAGSLNAQIIESQTSAFIDQNANVNTDRTDVGIAQTVNVSAVNDAKAFGVAINVSGALVALAGGIDVGVIRNDTTASINPGADVHASLDIDVHGLSRRDTDSLVGGVGVALIGITGSVSLYSIGAVLDPATKDYLDSINGVGDVQGYIDGQIFNVANQAGNGLVNVLNRYAQTVGGNQAAATAIQNAAPTSAVSNAINVAAPSLGTRAIVDGATLDAGNDVNVLAQERTDAVTDTSFTFSFGSPLSLAIDAGILNTHDNAEAMIRGNANILAEDVNVRGTSDSSPEVAATIAINNADNTTRAAIEGGTITATKDVSVTATDNATVTYTALGLGFSGLQARVALNNIDNTIDAHISGAGTVVTATNEVDVHAVDNAVIETTAIAVSIGSDLGIAASVATNKVENDITAFIDAATVSSVNTTVDVDATSNDELTVITAGGLFAQTFGLGGSVSINEVANVIDARIGAGANVTAPGTITVTADENGSITALAGGLSVSPNAGIGAAVTTNDINSSVTARIESSTVTSEASTVTVTATTDTPILAIAIGGAGAGTFAAGGSVALNDISNTLDAHISGNTANVSAPGAITVSATDNATIEAFGGGLAGAGTAAIGAALATNDIGSTLTAFITGATVDSSAATVSVTATANADVTVLTIGGAGAGAFAAGGSVSLNDLHNTIDAHISGGSANVTAPGAITVSAVDNSNIDAIGGGVAGAGGAAFGAAVGTNDIGGTLTAYIENATVESANAGVSVTATENANLFVLTVGGAGAGGFAAGGSVSFNDIHNTVDAHISGNSGNV